MITLDIFFQGYCNQYVYMHICITFSLFHLSILIAHNQTKIWGAWAKTWGFSPLAPYLFGEFTEAISRLLLRHNDAKP